MTGDEGCGKSRLAHEIGNEFNQDKCIEHPIVRLINSANRSELEKDFNQLFDEICNSDNSDNLDIFNKIQTIKQKIKEAYSNFLLIFDNVNQYSDIQDVIESLPEDKVKIIITTQNKEIINFEYQIQNRFHIFKISLFNEEEIRLYLKENLCSSRKKFEDEDIDEIVGIFGDSMISPLYLYNVVDAIHKRPAVDLDRLLRDIKL